MGNRHPRRSPQATHLTRQQTNDRVLRQWSDHIQLPSTIISLIQFYAHVEDFDTEKSDPFYVFSAGHGCELELPPSSLARAQSAPHRANNQLPKRPRSGTTGDDDLFHVKKTFGPHSTLILREPKSPSFGWVYGTTHIDALLPLTSFSWTFYVHTISKSVVIGLVSSSMTSANHENIYEYIRDTTPPPEPTGAIATLKRSLSRQSTSPAKRVRFIGWDINYNEITNSDSHFVGMNEMRENKNIPALVATGSENVLLYGITEDEDDEVPILEDEEHSFFDRETPPSPSSDDQFPFALARLKRSSSTIIGPKVLAGHKVTIQVSVEKYAEEDDRLVGVVTYFRDNARCPFDRENMRVFLPVKLAIFVSSDEDVIELIQ